MSDNITTKWDNDYRSNQFDVLYNNIMSDQAPGLDNREKNVFLNKAQLEVVKNHINAKGNKYTEGVDGSSKRQVELSSLIVNESYEIYPDKINTFSSHSWSLMTVDNENLADIKVNNIKFENNVLSILNETVTVVNEGDFYVIMTHTYMKGDALGFDVNKDGEITTVDLTSLIDLKLNKLIPEWVNVDDLQQALLADIDSTSNQWVFSTPKSSTEIITEYGLHTKTLTVVPVSHTEFDILTSRPYPYPPKFQAWRLISEDSLEIVIGPNQAPAVYNIRYVRMPDEIDLNDDTKPCTLPEVLHDEIVQRAVELAKNAWEGNLETTKALGERSE